MQFNNKKFGSKLDALSGDIYSFFDFDDEKFPPPPEDVFLLEDEDA